MLGLILTEEVMLSLIKYNIINVFGIYKKQFMY